jgi:hypothetical protein
MFLFLFFSISYPYLIKFHDFADSSLEGMKHQMIGATQAQQGMTLSIALLSHKSFKVYIISWMYSKKNFNENPHLSVSYIFIIKFNWFRKKEGVMFLGPPKDTTYKYLIRS